MRDRNTQFTLRSKRFAGWRRRRQLLVGVVTFVFCGVLVVANGAEQVDSGWATSQRPSITFEIKHADPEQEILLHDLLHHRKVPLLQTRPSTTPVEPEQPKQDNTATTTTTTPKQRPLRFAVRPDGVDGWKPNTPSIGALYEPLQLNPSAAPPEAATVENKDITPPEADADPAELQETKDADPEGDETDCGADSTLQWSSPSSPAAEQSAETDCGESKDELNDESANVDLDAERTETTAQEPAQLPQFDTNEDIGPITETEEGADAARAPSTNAREYDAAEAEPAAEQPVKKVIKLQPPKKAVAPPLTKQLVSLRSRIRSVLKGYYRKQLNSRDNDPWEVMHGMLAYGVHSRIRQGGPRGTPVTTVGWLCYNKPCKNLTLMYVTPKNELRAKYGVGLQGHLGQLLAMLAQCRVSEDYPIRVNKREFTIRDLIEAEKKTCYPKSELTFKLIALQYYLDLNETWVNDQGVDWDFPRLIREELAQPIRGAACGGTHRLSSLSLTVKNRLRRGEPLDGEYARANEFIQKYHRYAFSLQNRDGSLSTEWFRGRGDESDINRRIKTTGHILEWLCYSLSDEELRQPRTVAAVTYLANLMYSNYDNEWEVGPMSHATHALLLYDERVFQPFDGKDFTTAYKPRSKSSTATAQRIEVQTLRR